jgi:hypothetical protein
MPVALLKYSLNIYTLIPATCNKRQYVTLLHVYTRMKSGQTCQHNFLL